MDEEHAQIVIVIPDAGPPQVACSVPAKVLVAQDDGLTHTYLLAKDLGEMAALGLSKLKERG